MLETGRSVGVVFTTPSIGTGGFKSMLLSVSLSTSEWFDRDVSFVLRFFEVWDSSPELYSESRRRLSELSGPPLLSSDSEPSDSDELSSSDELSWSDSSSESGTLDNEDDASGLFSSSLTADATASPLVDVTCCIELSLGGCFREPAPPSVVSFGAAEVPAQCD